MPVSSLAALGAWMQRIFVLGLTLYSPLRCISAEERGLEDGLRVRGDGTSPRSGAGAQGLLVKVAEGRESQARLWWGTRAARRLPEFMVGKLGASYNVSERESTVKAEEKEAFIEGTIATPPAWDSSLCLAHWGVPQYQHEIDPNGYLIYINGREQLGGNKNLVADGMFIAKALNRTFVEYPVKDARVSPFDEATLGLGAYWDLTELCMYHRILDLRAFRNMMANGTIHAEGFVTIRSDTHEVLLRHMKNEENVVELLQEYKMTKVIALESTWKSGIKRDNLKYLKPNPFYLGVVRMLMEQQKDWEGGNYLAVQWRTELSTGNLTECYQEIKRELERHRERLGYGPHQVLVNTDLYGRTSGTYSATAQRAGADVLVLITKDYPEALDNHLQHFFRGIEDSGVKAFVSGLAVASSKVMLASSLNDPGYKDIEAAYRCNKPFSGYIELIKEWREEIMGKSADSVIQLFTLDIDEEQDSKEDGQE